MPGPPPKPTHLKVLSGNPGKRALPENEPQPTRGEPDPPDWLEGEALAEWNRVVPELAAIGLTALVDRAALVVYCQAWSAYVAASRVLAEQGPTSTGRNGELVKHPAAQIARDNADLMAKYGAQFGFSPASRARLTITKPDDGSLDIAAIIGA
jgi:P27 family predicted phage terminase small subunit